MRITTLNLWGYTGWAYRKDNVIKFLKECDSDVILLQENVLKTELSPDSQVTSLAEELGIPYRIQTLTRLLPTAEHIPFREGLGILSKHPIISSEAIASKKDPRDSSDRIIQLADIQTPDGILKVANVHLSITDEIDFATPQLKELVTILKTRGEERVVGGDFNIHKDIGIENFTSLWEPEYKLVSTENLITYPPTNERIDYFLLPKSYKLVKETLSPDGLSDHRAITIDFSR